MWDVLHPVDPSASRTSTKWSRTNSFPWESSAVIPQAKMVQVSSTMAVLKSVTETSNTRQAVTTLGNVGNTNSSTTTVNNVLSTVAT